MFTRLSHGPVENHVQIPVRIFVMEDNTTNIEKGAFPPTEELKCTTSALEKLTIKCLFLLYTANRLLSMTLHSMGLIKTRKKEITTPAVKTISPH